MLRRLFSLAMMVSGLFTAGYLVWEDVTLVAPEPVRLEAWLPPNAEIRPVGEIQPSTYRDGKQMSTFKIGVSFEEYQKLVQTSPYKPIVSHFVNGSNNVEYNYWLSRGDGAFYGAQGFLWAPSWGGVAYSTRWRCLNDRAWEASPAWDHLGAYFLAGMGLGVALIGYLVWPPRKPKRIHLVTENA